MADDKYASQPANFAAPGGEKAGQLQSQMSPPQYSPGQGQSMPPQQQNGQPPMVPQNGGYAPPNPQYGQPQVTTHLFS